MHKRTLFLAGLVLLSLSMGGWMLLFSQSFPREVLTSSVSAEGLIPPSETPQPPAGCSGTPNILFFNAFPTSILAGESSTLNWGAVTNADSVLVEPGIGGVATPGSTIVFPGSTTSYTLTARCGSYATTRQVTVNVRGASTPGPTNTPAIFTPTPTPSQSTPTRVPPQATTKQQVDVRQGPGTNFTIAGKISANTTTIIFGKSEDGQWFQVAFPDAAHPAWIASGLVTVVGSIDQLPVVATAPPPNPQPTRVIKLEWPGKMSLTESDTVRLSFFRSMEGTVIPVIETPGRRVEIASPIPVIAPQLIESPNSTDYDIWLTASLSGAAFKIDSLGDPRKRLQTEMTWIWNIKAQDAGKQELSAQIIVEWIPQKGGERNTQPIWISEKFRINVEQPWINLGTLNLINLLNGVLGSALAIPWLYERLKEFQNRRQKAIESKPRILLP